MALVPEDAFRELLADQPREAFADFVADLWRARGHEVRREGDRLRVDDGDLVVAPSVDDVADVRRDDEAGGAPDDASSAPDDARLVVATPPPDAAPGDVVGPDDLHGMLLYDVERERAADLFETHFDRPLSDDWSGWRGWLGGGDEADDEGGSERQGPSPGPLARAAAPLPTAPAGVRGLAGDRRVQALALVALVTVAATSWLLFVHQPEVPVDDETPFDFPGRASPADGSYRVVASAEWAVDGEPFYFERTRTYAATDLPVALERWTYSRVDGGYTIVEYQVGATEYSRTSWTNGTRFGERQQPRSDADRTTVVDSTRTVYSVDDASQSADAATVPSLPKRLLTMLTYEQTGTTAYDGRPVVRYVPRTGWTLRDLNPRDAPVQLRVTSASGEVLVSPTGTLLYADVQATTVRANTWGDVALNDSARLSLRYRVEGDVGRPTIPPWVPGLVNASGNATG